MADGPSWTFHQVASLVSEFPTAGGRGTPLTVIVATAPDPATQQNPLTTSEG